jgi:hypothetical protein
VLNETRANDGWWHAFRGPLEQRVASAEKDAQEKKDEAERLTQALSKERRKLADSEAMLKVCVQGVWSWVYVSIMGLWWVYGGFMVGLWCLYCRELSDADAVLQAWQHPKGSFVPILGLFYFYIRSLLPLEQTSDMPAATVTVATVCHTVGLFCFLTGLFLGVLVSSSGLCLGLFCSLPGPFLGIICLPGLFLGKP